MVAITGDSENTLAALADIAIAVKTFEDTDMYPPTVSRLAALAVVDILATVVSLRRGKAHAARLASYCRRALPAPMPG